MKIKRTASAQWTGSGKEGKGMLNSQSGVLSSTQYGFVSRFADGIGTNPEELLAAAHAGCFSMKLAFNLQEAGFTADAIDTTAVVIFEDGAITTVELDVVVKCKGMTPAALEPLVVNAKENCPVSKVLRADIKLVHTLTL